MSSVLSIKGLQYKVAKTAILKSIHLEMQENTYFSLAGINGAGKTTLIKLMLDLIRSRESGDIQIFGESCHQSSVRRLITYLPEKFSVKKQVSGAQYLEFVANSYSTSVDLKLVNELSEKLDFPSGKFSERVFTYSKGMMQKLGLISCFMLKKKLMILDEPLSGLDPSARYHFKELLREEKKNGLSLFYSTHMLADAEEICDHFAILHEGNIQFLGTPAECILKYGGGTLEQAYMGCISSKSRS